MNKGQYRTFTVEACAATTVTMAAYPGCTNDLSVTIDAPVSTSGCRGTTLEMPLSTSRGQTIAS